jgi:hypothetical protein
MKELHRDLVYKMPIPKELSRTGYCPVCKTKVKVLDKECVVFKGRPVIIYPDRIETKCPKCKSMLVDKK